MTNDNICTSIEQGKRLLELGLNPETADMFYMPIMHIDDGYCEGFYPKPECYPYSEISVNKELYLPAWSLTGLLELIPHTSQLVKDGGYYYEWSDMFSDDVDFRTKEYDNPLDAAFDLVCALIGQGIIKTVVE